MAIIMIKLRGATAPLIEMGRCQGVGREERECKQCNSDKMDDVCHWRVECDVFDFVREPLLKLMDHVDEDFKQKTKEQNTSVILTHACYTTILSLKCILAL